VTIITRLAARGDGVDNLGRFHLGAVPGDQIAEDGSIVPGPHRVTPACRHFGACGGCQLQHVDDSVFAQFLTDRITSALASQGLDAPEMRAPLLSPPKSRRRVALKAVRQGKRIMIGFSEEKSHKLVDLTDCPVMQPELFALIAPLRRFLPLIMKDRRSGEVRMTLSDSGVDMLLTSVEVEGLSATEALADFAQTHNLARLSIDEGYGPSARWEPDAVTVTLGGVAVGLPDNAFLQATREGETALIASVREAVGVSTKVTDLFAGLGTFALSVPGVVHAAEGARDMILALQQVSNRTNNGISCEHRDLFRRPLTPAELSRFDAAIIDPPRAGAKEQVEHLAQSSVRRIAFVSCNPSTFGRDAKTLIDGGYRLDWVQPVGQFRWSTHVELAAQFSRQ
jgi:23S rRNA (uracil1939-C5)-methyltransferase